VRHGRFTYALLTQLDGTHPLWSELVREVNNDLGGAQHAVLSEGFATTPIFDAPPSAQAETTAPMETTGSEKKWAIVVGVSDYDDPGINDLQFSDDAKSVADVLEKQAGFPKHQVVLMTSDQTEAHLKPTRSNILSELWKLAKSDNKLGKDDTFLLYFSGHALQQLHDSRLVPMGAKVDGSSGDNPELIQAWRDSTLTSEDIAAPLSQIDAGHVIIVLDASASAEFCQSLLQAALPTEKKDGSAVVLSAAGSDERAWESPELQHGAFTNYFLEGLRGKAVEDGQITMLSLSNYLWSSFKDLKNPYRQTPHVYSAISDPIVLVPQKTGNAVPLEK
jgi:uncharacterized caspase-like protein